MTRDKWFIKNDTKEVWWMDSKKATFKNGKLQQFVRNLRQCWIEIKYKFIYNYYLKWKYRILTALSFMKLAWRSLRGKVGIMDTELMESNAGYKCFYYLDRILIYQTHPYLN